MYAIRSYYVLHGKKVSTQMSFSLRFALSPAERDLFNQLKALDKQTRNNFV